MLAPGGVAPRDGDGSDDAVAGAGRGNGIMTCGDHCHGGCGASNANLM